ncbi:hypothetical protein NP233_g3111 [Leucocoprinus birnbaumii]|uniref:Uncharacterized protein n=1 Tax=Leucocoprinus birnbaumii TaxID=56174 RepID=A0AAD5YWQ2_9AGAR|nr:hypothetical protein NP233_g3111 [Leucocoprinus birnbaumii]
MANFYQPPMMPGSGINQVWSIINIHRLSSSVLKQVPSIRSQQSVQTGPYWNAHDYSRPRAASFSTPAQALRGGRSYDYAAERIRDNPDGPSSADLSQAKHWYRQAYQLGSLDGLSSWEIGHAAAYQAYRISRDYPPVHDSPGHERETLIGLAVAEGARSTSHGREREADANTAASETAARTASRIYDQTHSQYTNDYRARPMYTTATYSDPYDYGDDRSNGFSPELPSTRTRGRSRSRTRHPAFADSPPAVIPNAFPGYHASSASHSNGQASVPFEGISSSAPGPRYPPTPHPGSDFPPGTIVVSLPMTGASPAVLPQVYQTSQGTPPMQIPSYAPTGYNSYARPRSASFSYPQQYMPQKTYSHPQSYYPNMPYGLPANADQTIVIQRPKKHRNKHRRHHSRSR